MKFIADLHIHSHYSIATSKKLIPEYLNAWAGIKGIQVVGTGDFTHPGWSAELKEKLEPAEEGLFRLKSSCRLNEENLKCWDKSPEARFLLTAEISNIYKKDGAVRKVHNLVLAPDFETVDKIQTSLDRIGNITSDGRPILGLDSRDLLEICLDASENIFFIPAHIWTPWFSALGAKSGFDTIDECYGDLAHHIHAIETGLSSDPPMNWMCKFLDRFSIISNSDAHSPEKLGREANLFDTELSYLSIVQSLKLKDDGFKGTLEFFPQEGKYHLDGHRKCSVCWDPLETLKHDDICPVCGKKVTVGVLNRVAQLADREAIDERPNRLPFTSLIPLKEMISEMFGVGPNSKKVNAEYMNLIRKLGPELQILVDLPLEDIQKSGSSCLAEAVSRMRSRDVHVQSGFDGEFGVIRVFENREEAQNLTQSALFSEKRSPEKSESLLEFDLETFQRLRKEKITSPDLSIPEKNPPIVQHQDYLKPLNKEQCEAVRHESGPALVLAGPGTGKTRVLASRFVWLIQEKDIPPERILALTFTNQTAGEMRERIEHDLNDASLSKDLNIHTFHKLGYLFLKEYATHAGRTSDFLILEDEDKQQIVQTGFKLERKEIQPFLSRLSQLKSGMQTEDENDLKVLQIYDELLRAVNGFDLDDLIAKPVEILQTNENILHDFKNWFLHVLVDEVQDINGMQARLLRLLNPSDTDDLFMIGDPDQAIYGFRGADAKHVHQLKEDYPNLKVYSLSQSYRCSQNILKASGQMLASQSFLRGMDEGIRISIVQQETDKSEAEWIARTIEAMIGGLRFFSMDSDITAGHLHDDVKSLSDFGILCRIGRQMDVLRKALEDHSIPYQCAAETPFYHAPPFDQVMRVFRYWQQPQTPFLKNIFSSDLTDKISRIKIKKKVSSSLKVLIQSIFSELLTTHEKDVQRLIELSKSYGSDYSGFLGDLIMGQSQDTLNFDTEQVSLLTLHASKGLEFSCVFIPGCEEQLLPYTLFKEDIDIAEERRLLYVGMTRAKKLLYLSHAKKRMLFGQSLSQNSSSFLKNIQDELIQREVQTFHPKPKKDDGQIKLF